MNTLVSFVRARGLALSILAGALALAVLVPNAARAADEKPALPLKATFEKATSGKNGAPMIVHLKNESAQAITVSGDIALSVVVHNRPKSREVPAHKIDAGATMTLDNLAPEDKVTLKAEGYAPLVVVVLYSK